MPDQPTKEEFIVEASQRILASMFANDEKHPDAAVAVEYAESLWSELISNGYVRDLSLKR